MLYLDPLDEHEPRMAFPPELVDEILIYLRHDKRTLLNCSLVAKSWVYASQKLYYWDQCFTPKTYQTWRETASPTSTELLQHVRSLTCSWFTSLYDFHADHLKLFHRLQHLTLTHIESIQLDIINLLSASQNTLSSLCLRYVPIYDSVLTNLIDYFPNLRELHIDQVAIQKDNSTTPSASRPLRGKLRLTCLWSRDMAVLSSCLSKLELAYDELEVTSSLNQPYLYLPAIVYGCGKALARLELEPLDGISILTLENCSGLRELVFPTFPDGPRRVELSLVESIASTNMRKILFVPYFRGDGWNPINWSPLDTVLSNLVDRLRASGYEHTLELEFQLKPEFTEAYLKVGLDAYFPQFWGKGRVNLLDTSGKTFYCSDR